MHLWVLDQVQQIHLQIHPHMHIQIHLQIYSQIQKGPPSPAPGRAQVQITTRAVGACIGGENWGVLSESCPYTKAKAPLRKVGREPTGTAALPANQMESGPASV